MKESSIFEKIVAGLAVTGIAGLVVLYAKLEVMDNRVRAIETDKDADERQDQTIVKFWKLHSWPKTQIDKIRDKLDMDIESWPDL